jgi:hypothetical protein
MSHRKRGANAILGNGRSTLRHDRPVRSLGHRLAVARRLGYWSESVVRIVRIPTLIGTAQAPIRGIACSLCSLGLILASTVVRAEGPASGPASPSHEAPSSSRESEADTPGHVLTIEVHGFGGMSVTSGDVSAVGGPTVTFSLPIVERWELELGLTAIKPDHQPWLGSLELIGKRVFEVDERWSPHVNIGPLVSAEFGDDGVDVSGGLLAGVGVDYWLTPRWALGSDVNYRLLVGSDIRNVLTISFGFSVRI